MKTTSKKKTTLKKEEDLKNEANLKNEDDLKMMRMNLKMKTTYKHFFKLSKFGFSHFIDFKETANVPSVFQLRRQYH